jgi:hypothetical protein
MNSRIPDFRNNVTKERKDMKRTFIIFVCLTIMMSFLSSAEAINRSPKSNDSDKKEEPKERMVPQKAGATKDLQEGQKGKEKYDYFIDRNNNGIDDRLEKDIEAKQIKKPRIKETGPSSLEKNPAKVKPSPKTPEKTKDQSSSEKKKGTKAEKEEQNRGRDKR